MSLPSYQTAPPRNTVRNGAPRRSRTCNLLIRSQMLYPIELEAHVSRKTGNTIANVGSHGKHKFSKNICLGREWEERTKRKRKRARYAPPILHWVWGCWLLCRRQEAVAKLCLDRIGRMIKMRQLQKLFCFRYCEVRSFGSSKFFVETFRLKAPKGRWHTDGALCYWLREAKL